jgi:hypothetical protein
LNVDLIPLDIVKDTEVDHDLLVLASAATTNGHTTDIAKYVHEPLGAKQIFAERVWVLWRHRETTLLLLRAEGVTILKRV